MVSSDQRPPRPEESSGGHPATATDKVREHWRSTLALVGLAAEGSLNFVITVMVLLLVFGRAGEDEAGPEGAVEGIARQPFGQVLLMLLILGLACLVVWRSVQLWTGDEVEGDGLPERAKFAGLAVTYALIIGIAVMVLLQNWGRALDSGGDDTEEEATAFVLGWPGGELIVGAVGLGFIAVGLLAMWTYGFRGEFMKRIDRDRTGRMLEHKIEVVGRLGYVGRSMVNVIIGSLLIVAAVRHDPGEAGGMSKAMAGLANQTWGRALLLFIALGFFTYAVLRLIEAWYRRRSRPS